MSWQKNVRLRIGSVGDLEKGVICTGCGQDYCKSPFSYPTAGRAGLYEVPLDFSSKTQRAYPLGTPNPTSIPIKTLPGIPASGKLTSVEKINSYLSSQLSTRMP